MFLFHSTEFLVSANLAIIAAGLSLAQLGGGFNIVLETTPRQFTGISLGMTVLFKLVGGSIGPAIAGIYMQTHQATVKGIADSVASPYSYNLIFLSLALASLVPLVLVVIIKAKTSSNTMTLSTTWGSVRYEGLREIINKSSALKLYFVYLVNLQDVIPSLYK